MSVRVLIRADASATIGTGHIARMQTLAEAIQGQGGEACFLVRERLGVAELLKRSGSRDHFLLPALPEPPGEGVPDASAKPPHRSWLGTSWRQDLLDCEAALESGGPRSWDWLIVDHYGLDDRWQKAASGLAERVFVVDDLADRRHSADLLLDQNLGRNRSNYATLCGRDTSLLIGPQHALLRPEFARARLRAARPPEKTPDPHLLVSLGGSDPQGMGAAIVEQLAMRARHRRLSLTITHVTGLLGAQAGCAHGEERRDSVKIRRLHHVEDYANLLLSAHLVIGAAGGSAWERCTVGCVTQLVVLAPNQRSGAQALQSAGAAELLLDLGTRPQVQHADRALDLLEDPRRCATLSERARAQCDGLGTERVLQALKAPSVAFTHDRSSP